MAIGTITGTADEMPTQGSLFSGPGKEYNVVEKIEGDADIQVYGEIEDWYIVYNASTGNVGCIAKEDMPVETSGSPDIEIDTIFNYTNKEREKAEIHPVNLDEELCRLAKKKAEDMVKNNYFSHHSETLGSPFEMLKAQGILFTKAAENLAGNTSSDSAFYSWMNSETQRENILCSDYTRVGIGICSSPVYGRIFVQIFAN